MQIARQIYNISTAENGLIFFADGDPAYITKRFDLLDTGEKLLQEDFAQIAGKNEEANGKNYKYDFSYEETAGLMRKHIKAYAVEIEKYFKVVVFNYLFSNGDSHIKNFSLFSNNEYGDYLLTPFYDLLNTSLHVPGERALALELFKDGFTSEEFKHGSKFTKSDFYEFAGRIGIKENRLERIYDSMLEKSDEAEALIKRSFLSGDMKEEYLESYRRKFERLRR